MMWFWILTLLQIATLPSAWSLSLSSSKSACADVALKTNGTDSDSIEKCFTTFSKAFSPKVPASCNLPTSKQDAEYLPSRCDDPVALICGQGNTELAAIKTKELQVGTMISEAGESAEIQNFIKSNLPKTPVGAITRRCFEFYQINDAKNFEKCSAMEHKSLAKKMFTPERTQRLQDLFAKAKRETLSNLLYWQDRLENSPTNSVKKISYIKQMISRISRTELVLGENSHGQKDFSWSAEYDPAKNKIHINGMALLVDSSPEALKTILFHELGHGVGNVSFFSAKGASGRRIAKPMDKDFPFYPTLQCLHRSVARPADLACFKRQLTYCQQNKNCRFDESDFYTDSLKMFTASYPKNEFTTFPENQSRFGDPQFELCQDDQSEEAFADWMMVQSLSRNLNYNGEIASEEGNIDHLRKSFAAYCGLQQKQQALNESQMPRAVLDSHPLWKDRFEKIIFAHPNLKRALGCPAASAPDETSVGACGL